MGCGCNNDQGLGSAPSALFSLGVLAAIGVGGWVLIGWLFPEDDPWGKRLGRNPGLVGLWEIYGPVARASYHALNKSVPMSHFDVWDAIKARHLGVDPWEVQVALEDLQREGVVVDVGRGEWMRGV